MRATAQVQEIQEVRDAPQRGHAAEHAIEILRIALHFHHRLAAARRTARKIRIGWLPSIERFHKLLGHNRHQMRRTPSEILPDLRIGDVFGRAHVRRHRRVIGTDLRPQKAFGHISRAAAVAAGPQVARPFLRLRQPQFAADVRFRRGPQHILDGDEIRQMRLRMAVTGDICAIRNELKPCDFTVLGLHLPYPLHACFHFSRQCFIYFDIFRHNPFLYRFDTDSFPPRGCLFRLGNCRH